MRLYSSSKLEMVNKYIFRVILLQLVLNTKRIRNFLEDQSPLRPVKVFRAKSRSINDIHAQEPNCDSSGSVLNLNSMSTARGLGANRRTFRQRCGTLCSMETCESALSAEEI